jgi:hypothetical protein
MCTIMLFDKKVKGKGAICIIMHGKVLRIYLAENSRSCQVSCRDARKCSSDWQHDIVVGLWLTKRCIELIEGSLK